MLILLEKLATGANKGQKGAYKAPFYVLKVLTIGQTRVSINP